MKKIIDNNFDDITNTNIDIEDDIYDPPFSNFTDIEPSSVNRLTVPVDHSDVGSEQGSALLNFDNIKSGDLYRLGDHRLLCGDSTNDNDISKLLDGKITDALFFDPPYEKDFDFCFSVLTKALDYIKNGNLIIMAAQKVMMEIYKELSSIKSPEIRFLYDIVWNRITPSLSNAFNYPMIFHNSIQIYGIGGAFVDLESKSVRSMTGYPRMPSMISMQKDTSLGGYNKPIGLMMCLIDSFCKSTCIDLFAGTGTTMIACELTGRKSFSIEYDPEKVSLILKRFQLNSDKIIEKL